MNTPNPQPDLFTSLAGHRDGKTYSPEFDYTRLNGQMRDVYNLVSDGEWRSLRRMSDAVGHPEASISARLRDLRKSRFGSHTIERKRVAGGLFFYRMVPS